MSSESKVYTIAICLYPLATTLDFQGPIELLSMFSTPNLERFGQFYETAGIKTPSIRFDAVTLSHTRDPVPTTSGPFLLPEKTYAEAQEQYDILLIPGGGSQPKDQDPTLMEFLKRQAPGTKHILTVCTGSWILSGTGLLNGKRATTNKMMFRIIEGATKDLNIEWVAKARWVSTEDKKIWTASGVTAGQDMAAAFLEYLIGEEASKPMLAYVELLPNKVEDDIYAGIHGLV